MTCRISFCGFRCLTFAIGLVSEDVGSLHQSTQYSTDSAASSLLSWQVQVGSLSDPYVRIVVLRTYTCAVTSAYSGTLTRGRASVRGPGVALALGDVKSREISRSVNAP